MAVGEFQNKLSVMVVRSQFSPISSFLRRQESRVSGENRDPVFEMVPDFRRDDVWTPAGVYPVAERGRSDGFRIFIEDSKRSCFEHLKICINLAL